MPDFLFLVLVPKSDSQMPVLPPLWLLHQPGYFPFQYQYLLLDVCRYTAWSNFSISSACLIEEDKSPLSFQIAPCVCTTPKAYFKSVQMFASSKALIKAMISTFWADVCYCISCEVKSLVYKAAAIYIPILRIF